MIIENGILNNVGDSIIFEYDEPFRNISEINGFKDRTTIETSNKFFIKEFRYSKDNITFSYWQELTDMNLQNITLYECMYFEFRYTYDGVNGSGSLKILEFELLFKLKESVSSQQINDGECDPEFGTECGSAYDLYKFTELTKIKNLIESGVSKLYAHEARYFKGDGDINSADAIFREYSIIQFKTEGQCIKYMIPKNELPSNKLQITHFQIDFMDLPFVIQIRVSDWQQTFGANTMPAEKDILYLPLLDRIYTVNSVHLPKLMGTGSGTFYELSLIKWQNEVSSIKSDAIETELSELSRSFEDIFENEKISDERHHAKPQQYRPVTIMDDNVRTSLNIAPIPFEIINNYSIIADHYYDLTTLNLGETAVEYINCSGMNSELTFTFWVRIPDSHDTTINNIVIDGGDVMVYMNNGVFNVDILGDIASFSNPMLSSNEWYGITLNINNNTSQANIGIYQPKTFSTTINTENENSDLNLIHLETIQYTPSSFNSNTKYQLVGSQLHLTNIRVMCLNIDEDSQGLFLTQYIVDRNEYSVLIDNAKPQLPFITRRDVR